jgi:hypothetical protein
MWLPSLCVILSQFSLQKQNEAVPRKRHVGVMAQFRLRAHPILCHLISSGGDTLRTLFKGPPWPPSMNWSVELLLWSKQLDRKCWITLARKLNTAWTSYVPGKTRMLKLFSILQINSLGNKTFWVRFHISLAVLFCFLRFENYKPWKLRQFFRITVY